MIEHLDLHEVTLIGFSLGTGELARYIGQHGTDRVAACVMIESLAPTFAKTDQNPQGADQGAVTGVQQAILNDRYAWLTGLLNDFLNLEQNLGQRVSAETVKAMWQAGADASPLATWACPEGWLADFTGDITEINVPTLLLHGAADRILSIQGQGRRLHTALPHARYIEINNGPHLMCVTHAAGVNHEVLTFLNNPQSETRP